MSKVYLVGSGIGGVDYLTVKAKELIQTADVVVYDSLIPNEVLNLTKSHCKKLFVGKRKGFHSHSQNEINELLVDLSRTNNKIVRLKGGDPFLFSRGGEEIEHLNKNNVDFEVVPGISSVQALEVLLNIPLTHRDINHSVQILTGHDVESIDFKNLAEFSGNILILMGVSNLKEICTRLIQSGKNPLKPVAVISNLNIKPVGFEKGTLESFSNNSKVIKSPGIILISDVLNYLDNFQQEKPKILITRPKKIKDELSRKLEDLGFLPQNVPLISIKKNEEGVEKLKECIDNILDYSYLIFTSPTGVDIFFKEFKRKQKDLRVLSKLKICAIGPGTAKALNNFYLEPDLIPTEYSSDGIVELLEAKLKENDYILIPRSNSSNEKLRTCLSKLAKVDELGIYDIIVEKPDLNSIIKDNGIEFITATSSSIAKNLNTLLSKELKNKVKVFSIGKETTKELNEFSHVIESECFSIDGLIETINKNAFTNTIKEK